MIATFALTSPAFDSGGAVPPRHTCDGEDVSPALEWSAVPDGAHSLALIVDDPDAPGGTFTHWTAWGIDPAAGGIAEGEAPAAEGRNGFGTTGYRGPCPPPGHGPHRYFFRLYALAAPLELEPGASAQEVERAVEDRGAVAVAELVGTYER